MLAATIVFVLINGFFVAAEFSLVKVRPSRMKALAGAGNRRAGMVCTILEQLDLYLSSMASFQNTGLLFDSKGVDPDFVVEPDPEYYLRNGPDRVLDAALRWFEHPRRSPRRLSRNVR